MDDEILREQFFAGQETAPLIATSRAVANLPGLSTLIGAPVLHRRTVHDASSCGGVVAWGRKPSAARATAFAERHGLKLLRLEDGFLRSVGLGNQEPPLSIVLDDSGIYYDATAPSRLETLASAALTGAQQSRALALMAAWLAARVSKYNHAREYDGDLPERYVLVVDQTLGDASIRYGLADEASFQRMFAAALAEYPDCEVLVKVHPEVMAGRKRGHFNLEEVSRTPRVRLLGEDVHPVSLIERAKAIYTVTSQMGFEGLLWGKHVHTFGMPFYAGWGLTQDRLAAPGRRKTISLEALVYAALVEYPRYIDPETGERCEVERLIEWMALQRRTCSRFPSTVYATGFSFYKRPIVRRFFQGSCVEFVRRIDQIPTAAVQVAWGRENSTVRAGAVPVVRLEDGFIRSVGLGADLVRPLSWVMDQRGIYYDASCPSDLERILLETNFDEALTVRAQALLERLVAGGLTKYNVGTSSWQRPKPPVSGGAEARQRVILVPGQVESDASLAFGAPGIARNLDLLRAVRAANRDAYVIYKPHPDVVAGLRREGHGETDAGAWCDEIVEGADMGLLLPQIDEVHTMTSLTGFEALLRGKKVVCYGQPFYAGWGLTADILPVSRRTRRLSLDELVAGVLILYPTYVSRTTGRFTTPERALDELLAWRAGGVSVPWWGGVYRFLVQWLSLRL